MDLDLETLRLGRQFTDYWSFVCADTRSLPFEATSVDHISVRAVLHHLVPLRAALAEFARVLCPAGSITVIDGVALSEDEAASLDFESTRADLDAEPICGFGLGELSDQIEAVGLDVEQVVIDGTATLATPPYVSKTYTSDRFILNARRR